MVDPIIAKAAEDGAASMLLDVQRECIEWRSRALAAEAALAAERRRCAKLADDNADNDSRGLAQQ